MCSARAPCSIESRSPRPDAASYRALVKGYGKSWVLQAGQEALANARPSLHARRSRRCPASPHKRGLDRVDDVMEVNASSPNTERGLGRRAAYRSRANSHAYLAEILRGSRRPSPSAHRGSKSSRRGRCHTCMLTISGTLQATSAPPEPGFVAVPAPAAGHFSLRLRGESRATAASSVVSAVPELLSEATTTLESRPNPHPRRRRRDSGMARSRRVPSSCIRSCRSRFPG